MSAQGKRATRCRPSMTIDELRALGVTVDVETAARPFGIGRAKAYDLVRQERFPVPVHKAGTRLYCLTADVWSAVKGDTLQALQAQ